MFARFERSMFQTTTARTTPMPIPRRWRENETSGFVKEADQHDERAESEQADPSDEHAKVHLRTEAALRGADLLVHLLQALR